MKSTDILTGIMVIFGIVLLSRSLIIFPLATAIFVFLNQNNIYSLAYLVFISIFTPIWIAMDYYGTQTLKKRDSTVTFSGTWELVFWKKWVLGFGIVLLLLNFYSGYLLLNYLNSLDGILLFCYGIIGYLFSFVIAYLVKDISLKGLIVRFGSDFIREKE